MVSLNTLHFALWLIGIGATLVVLGLCYRQPILARWDMLAFQSWHPRLQRSSGFFRFIWPLGTTPVCLLLLAILFLSGWQAGFAATLVYTAAVTLERLIKLTFRRPRPFETLPGIQVQQPNRPHDPSHPSGDALRAWFLALVFPAAFQLPWPLTLLTCAIAVILSLGRIALGVHYPLDVLGGAGLGLLSAGISFYSYQLLMIS